MPIYEYRCEACGETTEVIQRLDEAPLEICPRCGGALKKLLSAPAFQFKGSGWYVTDYARSGGGGKSAEKPAAGESAKSESPAKSDAPAAPSTPVKPAPKD